MSRPKLVYLCTRFPWPHDRGDRLRAWHLLRQFSRHADVTLISFSDLPAEQVDIGPVADFCARTSASVRSIPHRPDSHESNVIYPADVDGDGLALTMRMEDPDGEFVLDPEEPRLLVKRGADDTGPFYRQFPEGEIFEWDGELDHIKVPREYGQFASDTAGTGGTYTDFVS